MNIEKITEKYPDFDDLKYKVNELVDAVNKLQKNATISKMEKVETENKDLSDKIGKLEIELDRTRKALYLAFEMLKDIKNDPDTNDELTQEIADRLSEITALEQKD